MGGLVKSERRVIMETRDRSGDKITISHVSEGVDGNFKQVKPHYVFSKHRGGHCNDTSFGSKENAELHFYNKKGKGEAVVTYA